jgi:uncharacterized membrane protein HdeD (DUF308 family)
MQRLLLLVMPMGVYLTVIGILLLAGVGFSLELLLAVLGVLLLLQIVVTRLLRRRAARESPPG